MKRLLRPILRQDRNGPKRRDPAPSRLRYRYERLRLTPFYRRLIHLGLPAFVISFAVLAYLADDGRRARLTGWFDDIKTSVQHRDAFMVKLLRIDGASTAVDTGIRGMLPVELPASSFDIDLDDLRTKIEGLDAVETVELRIRQDMLHITVKERTPAILWRHANGIELLDKTGHRVASVTAREVRPDLPVIAGEGAERHVPEALAIIHETGPILPRLRGLERMGERRWDVVLDRDQRIALPAHAPAAALARVIAMDQKDRLLARDVTLVDMRDPSRVTLRIGLGAQNRIRRLRGSPLIGPDGQLIDDETGAIATKSKG